MKPTHPLLPKDRTRRLLTLGAVLWLSCLVLTAAGLALFGVNRPYLGRLEFPGYFIGVLVALIYASVGMLILRYRPRLPFGWLFIALVISTLSIAAFFNPLRLRILSFIDRRFFRSRYDAEQILSNFSETLRSEVDLHNLGNHLLHVVYLTIRPKQISLWIRSRPAPHGPYSISGNRSDA